MVGGSACFVFLFSFDLHLGHHRILVSFFFFFTPGEGKKRKKTTRKYENKIFEKNLVSGENDIQFFFLRH